MKTQQDLASKDCQVCNRRRIKCDRRTPTCAKCEKRDLTCSGYGVLLKWDQGVASRGKLKGKSLPIKLTEESHPIVQLIGRSSSPDLRNGRLGDQRLAVTPFFSLETGTIPTLILPSQLQSSKERRLLNHYDKVVASIMAWADWLENPWRHIMIPLALESPPLLNAILAFAAKHLNAVSLSASREVTSIIPIHSDNFQQKALKLLAREIQELAREKGSVSLGVRKSLNQNRSNAILATVLVLCNVETVWPDSSIWQVHLKAARTVMASSQETQSNRSAEDSTLVFLEQELFIANTFASTTNFFNLTLDEDFKLKTAISKPGSIFIEFLKLLQMVTSLERQAITNPEVLVRSGVSPSGLRKLFAQARSRTLAMDNQFRVPGSHDFFHLGRTVDCFYHAGLIYSYRALLRDELLDTELFHEKQTQITTSRSELFLALGFAETSEPTFAQDLVWPLSIAGTEAKMKDEEIMVTAKLQQAMSETGFSNCQHALEFLNALWQNRDNSKRGEIEFDWISFAREWTEQGKTFLVF